MAVAVFDSSALVKLLVDEQGSDLVAQVWDESDVVVASRLAYPEVAAALGAARRAGRLAVAGERRARRRWGEYWAALRVVECTAEVTAAAAELTRRHVLGGADAVHLASALALAELAPLFMVYDQRLRVAAHDAGLAVVPAAS